MMWRKIKKAVVQNPIVLAAPLQTNLDKRPAAVTLLAPQDFTLDRVQKVALALLTIPAGIGFLTALFSAAWVLVAITAVILLLVGVILWVIRIRSAMIWKVTWYPDRVEVEDGRYGPPQIWTEPLSAYHGLVRDFGLIPRGNRYDPGQRVWGLLLAHRDPFKSILLYAAYETVGPDVIRYYEEQLGKLLLDD